MMVGNRSKTLHHLASVMAISATALILSISPCHPEQSEVRPGDTIGPQNWQLVKGMVGENLLHRIRQGYSFTIKQGRQIGPPKEYISATKRYSQQVRLSADGELLNYVAGMPFSDVSANDALA